MQTSARFKEEALQKVGTPVVGNDTVSLGDVRPDPSWTLERLAVYAKDEVSNSDHAEQQAILQANKSAIHLFRAGHALALARDKCKGEKHGEWKKFKKKHGLADTTANDAIRLYENAKTEDALIGLSVTQAKEKYVYPAKPKKSTKPSKTSGSDVTPKEAAPDAAHENEEGGVPKAQEGLGEVGQHEGDTSDAAIETTEGGEQHDVADEGGLTDEAAQTLADELEAIAQRLSEINQDDFGKATWTKVDIRRAKNAVAAVKERAVAIKRRLINEDPVS